MPLLESLVTHDLVLSALSPIERLRVMDKVSKASRDAVGSYDRRAFRINKVLSNYFEEDRKAEIHEMTEFRTLQYKTGMLISGSSALQFFDCIVYPDSDLDLYVSLNQAAPVTDFLVRIGYVYQPSPRQNDNLGVALNNAASGTGEVPLPWESYNDNGIAGVFNFLRNGKKVQIITCLKCPMDVILGFHLTCVFNVISHSHAYSLYPRTTFHRRGTIQLPHLDSENPQIQKAYDDALDKYTSRGWSITSDPCAADYYRTLEFRAQRHVGDSACWIIPLSPIEAAGEIKGVDQKYMELEADPVRANSWRQSVHFGKLRIAYDGRKHRNCKMFNTAARSFKLPLIVRTEEEMANEYYYDIELARMTCESIRKYDIQQSTVCEVERQFRRMPEFLDVPYKNLPTMNTDYTLRGFLYNLNHSFRSDPQYAFSFLKLNDKKRGLYVGIHVTATPQNVPRHSPLIFSVNREVIEWLYLENITVDIKGMSGQKLRWYQVSRGIMALGPEGDTEVVAETHTERMVKEMLEIEDSGDVQMVSAVNTAVPFNFVALMDAGVAAH
ncbi:hypothetical protein VKT23_010099 [Stygiomarasmius scandens]|uniref:F-box domain-containing protein n=1 Tax=Marasmiellus scandens TaxID=2682957 RepID=A0ABR1JC26_9AGAR